MLAAKPIPESAARKGDGIMDEPEFRAVVAHALGDSARWVDEDLSGDRAKATDYYLGKPLGNEEEGRSQVVLTEVADAVDGMVPSFLRVFFGPEHTVEFAPLGPETVAQAAEQTEYVRFVFERDNAGFLRALDVLKDGLIRKLGIFKWGWESSSDVRAVKLEGLTREELDGFAAIEEVTLSRVKLQKDGTYTVEATHGQGAGRARVWSVPPEEFLVDRNARGLETAKLVAHRTEKTRGQLLAMGIDEDDLDEHGGAGEGTVTLRSNQEELARRQTSGMQSDAELGKANKGILYTEAYLRIDYDGDGVAELRRVCCIGSGYFPVSNDPADEVPFSVFCPIPEPHTLIGRSIYDKTADMQRINSAVLRAILDNGAASAFPRMAILEGQVSTADVMNTAIGAPIRERVMNAVRPLEVPFTAEKLLGVLAFTQDVIERRTGRNKGAAGLDADALQSTGKEAVGAVLTGSQEQIELIARVFAEMTLKPMFRGLARLLKAKQTDPRMMKRGNQWASVSPSSWGADLDVQVNVALGSTFVDKKIATLMSVAADQKEVAMATGGLSSPIVPLAKMMRTRLQILTLQGIKDGESYYTPIPDDWQPPAPPPPPPDPEVLWMQTEKEMSHTKAMKELAIQADKLAVQREKQAQDYHLGVLKIEADIAMAKYAADATTHTAQADRDLEHALESARVEADLTLAAHRQHHDTTLPEAPV